MTKTIKRLSLLIMFTLLTIQQMHACLNGDSSVLKDGTVLYRDLITPAPQGHFYFTSNFKRGLLQLDDLYRSTKDLDYLSDKGLLLILLKRYREAIELYQWIEKTAPNRYSTSSNMGTAYELMGKNDSALFWIKRSVKINPKSHKGSEWLHVNILEAKIRGNSYITTKYLLNTDFGTDSVPSVVMKVKQLEELEKVIFYQLQERMSFVKPKDKIVAQLLFDLGNISYLLNERTEALQCYKAAKRYGFNDKLIDQRIYMVKHIDLFYHNAIHRPIGTKPKAIKPKLSTPSSDVKGKFNLIWGTFILSLLLVIVLVVRDFKHK